MREQTKKCSHCEKGFSWKNKSKKYCSTKCRVGAFRERKKQDHKQWEMEEELVSIYDQEPSVLKPLPTKLDYARLTFVLSFIGFVGSIGFYLGVIRQIYSPVLDKQKIEVLRVENQELEKTINILAEEIRKDD